jgi:hypothetical protein
MKRGSPIVQQSLARVLSVINYSKQPSTLPQAIAYLLDGIESKVSDPHISQLVIELICIVKC